MPQFRAQLPTASTRLGRGVASTVRRSGSRMLWVTTPVTSTTSACRGDATSRGPYRSASYPGPKAAPTSISQPLQEPASTWRTCTLPASSGGRPGSRSGAAGAGSALLPAARIRRITRSTLTSGDRPTSRRGQLRPQVGLLGGQVLQDPTRGQQEIADLGGADRVDDLAVPSLGDHQRGAAQDSQLLRQVARL